VVEVAVRFEWEDRGAVVLDADGRIRFPAVDRSPGLYRFMLARADGREVYIGETVELRRRLQQYRTPGSGQQTNLRMNARMMEHLRQGHPVRLAVVESVAGEVGGRVLALDLGRKEVRTLAESAALVAAENEGSAAVVNRL